MDTNYGAIISRYRLWIEDIELPQMHGYKYVALTLPRGTYSIRSARDGVGGTSVSLKIDQADDHYIFIDPVGFPRPTPILRVVDKVRGTEGVNKSTAVNVTSDSQVRLAERGILVGVSPQVTTRVAAEDLSAGSSDGAGEKPISIQDSEPTREQLEIQRLKAELAAAGKQTAETEEKVVNPQKADSRVQSVDERVVVTKLIDEIPDRYAQAAKPAGLGTERQLMPMMAMRKALVVGNDAYASLTPLQNAKGDAIAIANGLREVGYSVTLITDVDRSEMNAALRRFKSQLAGGDEVVVFYAGHAVQIDNVNYLLPVDISATSEDAVRDDAVELQRILDDVQSQRAKFTVAIIDACRDNPFQSVNGRSIGGTRGLSPTTAATGQMIVFSAGTGQQALDNLGAADKEKNGVFTRVLLKHLKRPGVSIDQMVRDVREEVFTLANSVGHEQVPAVYDQVVGRFYFVK